MNMISRSAFWGGHANCSPLLPRSRTCRDYTKTIKESVRAFSLSVIQIWLVMTSNFKMIAWQRWSCDAEVEKWTSRFGWWWRLTSPWCRDYDEPQNQSERKAQAEKWSLEMDSHGSRRDLAEMRWCGYLLSKPSLKWVRLELVPVTASSLREFEFVILGAGHMIA